MTTKSQPNSATTDAAIIADSSPLISLAILEQLELLTQLYQRVLIPPAVWSEVTVQGAGLPGSLAVSQAAWLDIQTPDPGILQPLAILVDRGEAEAIALAQSVSNSIVLLDDARARRVAERFGMRCIGTIGILRRAKRAGLISDIKPYVRQLQNSGIFIAPNLVEAVLRDVGELS
ncbi:DUF3368 domain-containing protein [filamentous cyanobacterium CCT1]|nr:DUF3368 domain-containing protein [filamentous cyanobacterium CCT1]